MVVHDGAAWRLSTLTWEWCQARGDALMTTATTERG